MATSFYIWSSSTSPEMMPADPHHQTPLLAGETTPKPAPSKVKRSSGGSSRAKRPPQRGLGVAQLERLCFQERLKMIHDAEQAREILPYQIPQLYNLPSSASSAAAFPRYPNGAWVESGSPAAGFCYLPSCRLPSGPLVGFGSGSLLQEQYALDRHRIQAANEVKTTVFAELPSNQRTVSSCITKHCELCATKQLLTGTENPGIIIGGGFEYSLMSGFNSSRDQEVNVGGYRGEMPASMRTEVREYEFFPQYQCTDGGGDSEFAEQQLTVGDYSASFIDLSLSL